MHGLDIEEVKLAGKPAEILKEQKGKILRYPTEAATLQAALSLCMPGDFLAISPGVYHENVHVDKDVTFYRDGDKGEVIIVSRHDTACLAESCLLVMKDITFAVEEGALMHHALHCDHAELEMENCEFYGGLYAMFASAHSKINAERCRFHSAYSFGATMMDSTAMFHDCYFFRNKEDGCSIGGADSRVTFAHCRIVDNQCFGLHVHGNAEIEMINSEVLRNGQSGIMITFEEDQKPKETSKDQDQTKEEAAIPRSRALVKNCRILENDWHGIFCLDASLVCEECDLRKNARQAIVLATHKTDINKTMERTSQPFLDVEYYNTIDCTGTVELSGNLGVRDDGENEISFGSELPFGWHEFSKEQVLDLYRRCCLTIQKKLHGNPEGYNDAIANDPAARIKIISLFKKIAQEEEVCYGRKGGQDQCSTEVSPSGVPALKYPEPQESEDISEVDVPIEHFLSPLGLLHLSEKLHGCKCFAVRDMMSMSNDDLLNLGLEAEGDRKMILSRLSALSGNMMKAQFLKEVNFNALVETTRYQAKGQNLKVKYTEWKKLRDVLMDQIGIGTAGAEMDAKMRGLFAEIDTDASSGIDVDELRIAVQRFGLSLATIDVEQLMEEADREKLGYINFELFCQVITAVLRT